jgi:hypothetical protein
MTPPGLSLMPGGVYEGRLLLMVLLMPRAKGSAQLRE